MSLPPQVLSSLSVTGHILEYYSHILEYYGHILEWCSHILEYYFSIEALPFIAGSILCGISSSGSLLLVGNVGVYETKVTIRENS